MFKEICQKLRDEAFLNENEFVEALQFSEHRGCVISGYFSDNIPKGGKLNALGKWYKPWFFKYVEKIYSCKKVNFLSLLFFLNHLFLECYRICTFKRLLSSSLKKYILGDSGVLLNIILIFVTFNLGYNSVWK